VAARAGFVKDVVFAMACSAMGRLFATNNQARKPVRPRRQLPANAGFDREITLVSPITEHFTCLMGGHAGGLCGAVAPGTDAGQSA
jgi:hypothetical protein